MLKIREATAADAPLIMTMIRELAQFERELGQVDADIEGLRREGIRIEPAFSCINWEVGRCTGSLCGLFSGFLDVGGAATLVR